MSYSVGRGVVVVALLACSTLLTGCISRTIVYSDEQVEQPVVVQQRKFYYYPSCQAYRDCETNRWHWVEGGVWKASYAQPKIVVVVKESPRLVELDCDEPKFRHATIVKQYPSKDVEVVVPRKSNGLARGHDKQDARAEADATPWYEMDGRKKYSNDSEDPQTSDKSKGNDRGKSKSDDKGKSDKKDEKSDKGKGKKKD